MFLSGWCVGPSWGRDVSTQGSFLYRGHGTARFLVQLLRPFTRVTDAARCVAIALSSPVFRQSCEKRLRPRHPTNGHARNGKRKAWNTASACSVTRIKTLLPTQYEFKRPTY